MSGGSVVNVMAMLTGNASGMVSSFGAGGEAAKAFKETYEKTAGAAVQSSKQIQEALEKEAATAKATSAAAQEAVAKAQISRDVAAAQATVAADREAVALARAAKAAEDAAAAKIAADTAGTAAAEEAAVAQAAAAERAANAATLATQQKVRAAAVAAEAAAGEAAKVAEAMRAEEAAMAAAARAAEIGAAQRKAATESMMGTLNKVALGTAAAGAVIGGVSLEMAGKFEKSTELLVTAGGEAQSQLQTIRDGILQVSQSTGVGAEALAEGEYTIEKAGMRGADGLKLLKAAAQAAVAEGVDMQTMTTALTSVMTTYGLSAEDSVSVTNQMVVAAGASKTTMQEFAGSLSTVLPIAQSAHLSFDQIGGAIATMTQHGTSAQEATQELRNAIQNLLAPNNVAVQEMNQLGISSQDVSQNLGTRGLTGTLDMMRSKVLESTDGGLVLLDMMKQSASAAKDMGLMIGHMDGPLKDWSQKLLDGGMTAKEYNKNIHTLGIEGSTTGAQFEALAKKSNGFNDEIKKGSPAAQTYVQAMEKMMGGTTGLQTMLMLTGDNMGSFITRTQEVGAAAQETGDDISTNAATQATLAAETERVKATFEALAIQLGTALMPALKDLLGGLLDGVHWLQENHEVAQAFGEILAVVAGSIVAITAASWAWNAAQEAGVLLLPIVTAGMVGLDAAMDANPVGLVTLAIEALIAILAGLAFGIKAAYENIGWFHDAVDAINKTMHDAGDGIASFTKDAAENLGRFREENGRNFDGFNADATRNISDFNTTTNGMLSDWVKNTGGMITDWNNNSTGMFNDFNRSTQGMFDDFFSNTGGMVSDWVGSTGSMFNDFNNNTKGMFNDFFGYVGDGWRGFWKDPIGETRKFTDNTRGMLLDWNRSTQGMFDDFFANTTNGFNGWREDNGRATASFEADATRNISDFNTTTNGMFADFFNNTINGFRGWREDNGRATEDFNRQATKNISDFNTTTNGMFVDFWNNTTSGFQGWRNDNAQATQDFNTQGTANIASFNETGNGMFADFFSNTGGMVADWAGNTAGMFNDWGANTRGMFSDWQQQTTGETRTFTDQAIQNVNDFNTTTNGMFADFVNNTGGMISDWSSNTTGMFEDFNSNTNGMFEDFVNNAVDAVGNFARDFTDAGAHAVQGFVNGLMDGVGDVVNAAGDIGQHAIDAVRDILGIHSPSRVMFDDGVNTTQGFANGVRDNSGAAVDAVTSMAKDTAAAGAQAGQDTAQAFGKGIKSLQDYASDELANSIANVTKQATSGRDAQFAFGKATLQAADSADQLRAKLGGDVSAAINQVTGDFNVNSAAGQQANQMMKDVRDRGMAVATTMSQDVTKGSNDVTGAMQGTVNALMDTARHMGLTDSQAQALTRSVLGVPPGVDINTWMSDEAKAMADKTAASLSPNSIPRQVNVSVSMAVYGQAEIQAAQAAMDNLKANSMIAANQFASGNAYRANGGEVSHLATGGFPHGGWVTGSGTENSDSIAAMLSNHEFVVKAASAQKYGPAMMKAINDGTWQPSVSVAASHNTPTAWTPPSSGSAQAGAAGGGDVTIVLDIPELGGRLNARIKSVSSNQSTSIIEALNRATRNSAGVPAGGY